MSDLIKWGLLGVGAYLLYNSLSSATTTAAATGTIPTTPVSPGGSPTTGTPVVVTPKTPVTPVSASCDVARQVLAAAGGPNVKLTADQWNYYWSQVTGVTQTADLFPAGNRDTLLSFDQYLLARQGAGIGVSSDCNFTIPDQPGPAGLAGYIRLGFPKNYVRRGTPMRAR